MKTLTLNIVFALAFLLPIENSNAQSSMADNILGGMTCVMVQHSVADFDTWHLAYNKDGGRRGEAGIAEKLILRGADDANFITVIFELENVEKGKHFFADPNTPKLMGAAGVTSKPIFTYFKVNNSGIPNEKSFLIVRHTVKDYDYWKKEFDKHQNVRSQYNLSLTALGRDLENPLNIVAIFNGHDTNKIESFLNKSNLKEAMKKAGITSEPIQEIMVRSKK